MAVGHAEGRPLRSTPTFVFPGVHTGLISNLSRETVELTVCSKVTTSKFAIKEQKPAPWSSSTQILEEGLGAVLFVAAQETVSLSSKT